MLSNYIEDHNLFDIMYPRMWTHSAFPAWWRADRGMGEILRQGSNWVMSYLTTTSGPNMGLRADKRWASSHVDTVYSFLFMWQTSQNLFCFYHNYSLWPTWHADIRPSGRAAEVAFQRPRLWTESTCEVRPWKTWWVAGGCDGKIKAKYTTPRRNDQTQHWSGGKIHDIHRARPRSVSLLVLCWVSHPEYYITVMSESVWYRGCEIFVTEPHGF